MGGQGGNGIQIRKIGYDPLPSQEAFHCSVERFKGFSGPIGSGKSQALCHEAIKLSYLNAGCMGLLGAPTFPMLRDATQRAFLEILDENGIPHEINKAENVLTFRDTGSKVAFRAVDDFERLRGTNLAWFGMDELTYCPEDAWLRLEGRLRDPKASRLCGFAVWTPKGFDWVYRRFVEEPVAGYFVVRAQPSENKHILEKVPDFYERLKKSYDTRFFAQEVLGEYLENGGDRVYHAFRRAENVASVALDPRLPLLWTLDFNVDPMSSLVLQIQSGKVVVLDEIVLSRASTHDAFEEFRNRYSMHVAGVTVYGDASGHSMQTSGTNDYEILRQRMRRAGYMKVQFKTQRSNPAVRQRVELTNATIRNANGDIGLLVNPACKELIKDFEEVCFKAGSSVIDKDRDSSRTHLSDALGYLLREELGPKSKVGERNQALPGVLV